MRQRLMVVLWVVFFIGAGASTRAWADCYPQYDICGTVASHNPNFPLNPGIFDVQQDQELYVKLSLIHISEPTRPY